MYLLLLAFLLILPCQLEAAAVPPVVTRARHTVDLIYNMEFDAALKAARTMIDAAPSHPAGYFYRAATYWQWRLVVHQALQQAELTSRFSESASQTIHIAEQLPSSQSVEAAFYLGAAYGMQARMYVVEKHYLKALEAAKKGGAYLKQCVNIDSTYDDAYLGLGLYHYALTRAPNLLRGVLQWIIGIKGDRDRGLQELERARTQGILSAPEAASVLARIYASSHERQYHKSYHLLQGLVRRYPNNFDYRFRLLFVSSCLGRWQQARQISRDLIADIEQGRPYYTSQWLPRLRYRIAETYVLQGNPHTARQLLRRLQSQPLEQTLRAWVTLRLGNTHDLQGNRSTARAFYQRVEGESKAQELAEQYLTAPFDPSQIDIKPLDKII